MSVDKLRDYAALGREGRELVHQSETALMRSLQGAVSALFGYCDHPEAGKALEKLSEDLKYSDPVSSPALADAEQNLLACIQELEQAAADGETEAVLSLCRQAQALLQERNRLCRLYKGK